MWKYSVALALIILVVSGCTSVGTLGIVTKSTANPGALLENAQGYEELGITEGAACRHFVLAVAPFGNSTFERAVEDALEKTGGDALINVTTTSSLFGFAPIYNLYSFTCTTVKGIAIRFN